VCLGEFTKQETGSIVLMDLIASLQVIVDALVEGDDVSKFVGGTLSLIKMASSTFDVSLEAPVDLSGPVDLQGMINDLGASAVVIVFSENDEVWEPLSDILTVLYHHLHRVHLPWFRCICHP
jgi:hypothetical protein